MWECPPRRIDAEGEPTQHQSGSWTPSGSITCASLLFTATSLAEPLFLQTRPRAGSQPVGTVLSQGPVVDPLGVIAACGPNDSARSHQDVVVDVKRGLLHHGLEAGERRDPPVGVVAAQRRGRVELSDEGVGKAGRHGIEGCESAVCTEVGVVEHLRLDEQPVLAHAPDPVEGEHRVPEVVDHAEEQHEIKLSERLGRKVVDVTDDIRNLRVQKPARDRESGLIRSDVVERQNVGSAPLELEREETVASPDIQGAQAAAVGRDGRWASTAGVSFSLPV